MLAAYGSRPRKVSLLLLWRRDVYSIRNIDENKQIVYTPARNSISGGSTIIRFLRHTPSLSRGDDGSEIATDVTRRR